MAKPWLPDVTRSLLGPSRGVPGPLPFGHLFYRFSDGFGSILDSNLGPKVVPKSVSRCIPFSIPFLDQFRVVGAQPGPLTNPSRLIFLNILENQPFQGNVNFGPGLEI